jgi:hypothetical protein
MQIKTPVYCTHDRYRIGDINVMESPKRIQTQKRKTMGLTIDLFRNQIKEISLIIIFITARIA